MGLFRSCMKYPISILPFEGRAIAYGKRRSDFAQRSQWKRRSPRDFDLRKVAISQHPDSMLLSRNFTLRPPFPLRALREIASCFDMRYPCALRGGSLRALLVEFGSKNTPSLNLVIPSLNNLLCTRTPKAQS
jgi:hypothetical protein